MFGPALLCVTVSSERYFPIQWHSVFIALFLPFFSAFSVSFFTTRSLNVDSHKYRRNQAHWPIVKPFSHSFPRIINVYSLFVLSFVFFFFFFFKFHSRSQPSDITTKRLLKCSLSLNISFHFIIVIFIENFIFRLFYCTYSYCCHSSFSILCLLFVCHFVLCKEKSACLLCAMLCLCDGLRFASISF